MAGMRSCRAMCGGASPTLSCCMGRRCMLPSAFPPSAGCVSESVAMLLPSLLCPRCVPSTRNWESAVSCMPACTCASKLAWAAEATQGVQHWGPGHVHDGMLCCAIGCPLCGCTPPRMPTMQITTAARAAMERCAADHCMPGATPPSACSWLHLHTHIRWAGTCTGRPAACLHLLPCMGAVVDGCPAALSQPPFPAPLLYCRRSCKSGRRCGWPSSKPTSGAGWGAVARATSRVSWPPPATT